MRSSTPTFELFHANSFICITNVLYAGPLIIHFYTTMKTFRTRARASLRVNAVTLKFCWGGGGGCLRALPDENIAR